jgi:hypothetical protein
MSEIEHPNFENWLYENTKSFEYPPTPDVARSIHWDTVKSIPKRRTGLNRPLLAGVIAVVLIAILGLLAVPTVRAQILEFLELGGIRIFLGGPTGTPTATAGSSETPSPTEIPSGISETPAKTPISALNFLENLSGETSLSQARGAVDYPVRLPTYPTDLGEPDLVYLQDIGGPVVVLVWLQPGENDAVRLSLLELGPGALGEKTPPEVIQETEVNGKRAIWTEGAHLLNFKNGIQLVQFVAQGNILIWESEGITYRMESNLTLEEAVKIAESLQ